MVVAVVAVRCVEADDVAGGERPAAETTNRNVNDSFIPFPHIPGLVESPVRALGVFKVADLRAVVRAGNRVIALADTEIRVVPRIGVGIAQNITRRIVWPVG